MNKKSIVILVAAFCGMGMSMPSCPGQQAMQQQIDTLQTSNADLTKRVQALDSQMKQTQADVAQVKTLMELMKKAIDDQREGMNLLNNNIKEIETKMTAAAAAKPAPKAKPAASKPAAKKKH